ncbi:unnamed protein product [Musa acuminata subsp. malaccensis]|uniref:Dof zinc finger protein n=1 Tax=Musa acuminata subsp. malaccensis TaxID=214687 RepID=A0A804LAY5_MUSAM|nr:PREDICTED: dof zinc finger protein DOF2.1-like [Musa acuminata subsp. malaccensis]CAG1865406.1 unnamed protein product [Musa acuminata subsp. malaccensis]
MASIPPPEVVRGCPKGTTAVAEALQQEEMVRPPVPEPSLECPGCESINTNFCYYNNYSLSQPRNFCKGCRRHWTKGGSLRTVPVGGGCRNNKKSSSSRGARGQQAFDTDSTPPLCNALLPSLLAIASLQKQQSAHQAFLLGNPTPEPGWSAGFPDILTTAFLDGTGDPSGFLYSINRGGYGDADSNEEEQQLLLPFRGGLGGATTTTAAAFDVEDEDDKTLIGSLLP